MKQTITPLSTCFLLSLHFALCTLHSSAAVPLKWTVETSRVQPVVFDAVRGETLALEAAFQSYGTPLAMTDQTCCIFYQTNGMGSAWWTAPATVSQTNRVSATFTPSMDPGAGVVVGFLGATGSIYRAAFTLRFRRGPGATPNAIDAPVPILDLANTTVINPPWPTTNDFQTATNLMQTALKEYVDSEIEGAGLVTPSAVTNIAGYVVSTNGFATETWVTNKIAQIHSGTDTNDVCAIVTNDVAGSTVVGSRFATPVVYSYTSESVDYAITNLAVRWNGEYWEMLVAGWADNQTYHDGWYKCATTNWNDGNPYCSVNSNLLTDAVTVWIGNKTATGFSQNIGDGLRTYANGTTEYTVSNGTHNALGLAYLRELVPTVTSTVTKAYVESLGIEAGVSAATVTGIVERATNDLATVAYSGSYDDLDDRPTIPTASTLASSFASKQTESAVSAISAHLNAEDAHFVSTNYDSSVRMPEAYVEVKIDGTWITIWKEMTRWTKFVGSAFDWDGWGGFYAWGTNVTANISSLWNTKADRCWGIYDSETGGYSPEGYTQISSSNILIAANMAYQRTVTTGGSVWVLQCNNGHATLGGTTNGYFRVLDGDGNVQFEIIEGNQQELGADADGITVSNSTTPPTITLTYSVIAPSHPTLKICDDLQEGDWKTETDSDCIANVTWSGSSGAYVATVQGKTSPCSQMFVKATYMSGAETYVNNRAPVGMSSIYLNGTKYYLGTATIGGNTVLTLSTTAPSN